MASPLYAADTESSVNERLPFSSQELEAHWQIDCEKTLDKLALSLKAIANSPQPTTERQLSEKLSPFHSTLQKCAFIHNTEGTGRYKPCPSYHNIYKQLQQITDRQSRSKQFSSNGSPDTKTSTIKLRKMLTSEPC